MKDTTKIYLADTYALLELIRGNKNYEPYLDKILLVTQLNLMELYYSLLKNEGMKTANELYDFFSTRTIPISNLSIVYGMHFKLKFAKEKLSYVDCVGYALAHLMKIKFLTGDQKFENKKNVEFIK